MHDLISTPCHLVQAPRSSPHSHRRSPHPFPQEIDQADGRGWVGCTWRGLAPEMRSAVGRQRAAEQQWRLRLRAPVQLLHELWERRLEVGLLRLGQPSV